MRSETERGYCFGGMKVGPTVRILSLSSAVAVVSAGRRCAGAVGGAAGAAPFLAAGGVGAPFGCARCCIRLALSSVTIALAAGVTSNQIVACLEAVTPVTGSARVVGCAPKVALALGYDVDAALERYDP